MIPYLILLLVVIIIVIFLIFRNISLKFKEVLIKIDEGEENIDKEIEKKYELLNKICESINEINKTKVIKSLYKIKKKSSDNYKLDRDMADVYNELKEYLLANKSFVPDDENAKIINDLYDNEIELNATKSFYNDNVEIYNKLVSSFPSNIIASSKKYDFKYLYSFKEEELFEIMKREKEEKERKKEKEKKAKIREESTDVDVEDDNEEESDE